MRSKKEWMLFSVEVAVIVLLSFVVSLAFTGCGKKQAIKPEPEIKKEEIIVILPDMPLLPEDKECPEFPPDMPPLPIIVEKSTVPDNVFLNESSIVIYIVGTWEKEGDCLWNIAEIIYNDPFMWKIIYNANKNIIKNPDLIYPGQHLICPMD